MGLNGIDVSGWQEGIDLSAVAADFVIMKATQGTGFVSKDFARQYQQAKENGKLVGCYHYAEGGDYVAEANHFLDVVGNRVGEAILCLDWEGQDNPTFGKNDFDWVKGFCDYVFSKTGVKPLVYIQKSAMERIDGIGDYGLWIAQYPDYTPTGYQETPWNEGAYACAIRQYSSVGQISGYNGNLDLDKFYGDADSWRAYAAINGENVPPEPTPQPVVNTPDGSTLELVERTMSGEFGDGDDRRANLGTRYDEVQSFINHIYEASDNDLANEVLSGKYGNGNTRKAVLGDRYSEVQGIVNGEAEKKYYTIQSGDVLSKIAAANGTTVDNLVRLNGIGNPNLIYAGTKINTYDQFQTKGRLPQAYQISGKSERSSTNRRP